ncbi:uncharacterized protein B0H18DRAFT_1183390, partial [Fomitopsis serialis]|uniref:uncharacterized protein n=1 Tax=Fomitopsis serialis TaxID=139415 RepID=UPI002007451E
LLIFIASIVVAVFTLIAAGSPNGDFFEGIAVDFGTSYYALTVSLNIIVTILICARMLYMSKGVSAVLGPENSKLYTGLTAIFVESAALYSLAGIMFIIPYARNSQTAIIFGDIYGDVSCLAPMLIVYRIITRRAWGKDTVDMAVSSVLFAQGTTSTRQETESRE